MIGQLIAAGFVLFHGISTLRGRRGYARFESDRLRRIFAGCTFFVAFIIIAMAFVERYQLLEENIYLIVYAASVLIPLTVIISLRLVYGNRR